jgi:hypothetical protein
VAQHDERSLERPERTARRASAAKKRYRMRSTRHEDRSASCLVSTHDRISGTHTQSAGECCGDGAEEAPVGLGQFGPVDLAAQHCELVTQDNDLDVLRATRRHREASEGAEESVQDAEHEASASAGIVAGQTPRPSIRHPQVFAGGVIAQGTRPLGSSSMSKLTREVPFHKDRGWREPRERVSVHLLQSTA